MKPSNNLKSVTTKIFLNIYEISSIFREEINIFKKFRIERKTNKQRLRNNESNK